ncbi:hypothetical protein B0H11DRAFT_1902479 [Mycena galericulata]|nr:hypothetical protein B0H11DRAFT_1902479 [Mycena galericulata]
MRLHKNKARYNRLMRLVRYYGNQFLQTGKTISQQVPATLEKVIALIKNEFKYFQRFQGAWPVRDFLKQYLANNTDKFKQDWDDDDNEVSDAEMETSDNARTEDSEEEEAEICEDTDLKDEEIPEPDEYEELNAEGVEPLDESFFSSPVKIQKEKFDPATPPMKNSSKKSPNKTPKPKLKPKSRAHKSTVVASPSPLKRKVSETGNEEVLSPAKKHKPTSPANFVTLSPIARSKIPSICPAPFCEDVVPKILSPILVSLFSEKRKLIRKDGSHTPGSSQLTKQICTAIKQDTAHQEMDVSWPSPIWLKFLECIDHKVFAFSRSPSKFKYANLGCGYFSPKGLFIIKSTLKELAKNNDDDDVANTLYDTLSQLADEPKSWDAFDDSSNLISPAKFLEFILVPHVAASLISEDLEISLRVNGDEPQKVDIVVPVRNVASQPPRHRKPVNLKLPDPKLITLDDFPPVAAVFPPPILL